MAVEVFGREGCSLEAGNRKKIWLHLGLSKVVRGSHGILLWKHIRGGWNKFASFMRFDVGDGTRVRCWHGDSSFLEKYPELF